MQACKKKKKGPISADFLFRSRTMWGCSRGLCVVPGRSPEALVLFGHRAMTWPWCNWVYLCFCSLLFFFLFFFICSELLPSLSDIKHSETGKWAPGTRVDGGGGRGGDSLCAFGIAPLFAEAIMLFARMISIWPKNNIRQVRNWKKRKKKRSQANGWHHAARISFSVYSLFLHCWCNCSIPSGPLSALQFTQERDRAIKREAENK